MLRMLFIAVFAAGLLAPAAAQIKVKRASGTMEQAIDGDDFIFAPASAGESFRVRLCGVDAPELTEPHGVEAREALAQILAGKNLSLELIKGLPPIKIYESQGQEFTLDRELAVVYIVGERESINLRLVKQGAVRHMHLVSAFCGNNLIPARLDAAETEARSEARGIWSE